MALFGEMKVIVDIYYSSYSTIDLAGISNGEVLMKAATKSASLIGKRSFNYNFSQPATASGFGFENPNDVDSFLLKIGIRYL